MALKDDLESCRRENLRRLDDLEEDLERLLRPQTGVIAHLGTCVSKAKNKFNYILGGIAVVLVVIGILAAMGFLFVDGMSGDVRAATASAGEAHRGLGEIRVENAALGSDMKHMTQTMQELKQSLDRMNQTLRDIQDERNRCGPEGPK